jgi:DNA-binding transcriptional MerR regulator
MMLLEPADVARALAVSSARIRQLARAGRLVPIARTPRGTRLFSAESVQLLIVERARRPARAGR